MLKKLKALWNVPEQLSEQIDKLVNIDRYLRHLCRIFEDRLPNGLGLTEQDRLMIREVHNLVTTKLEGYLKAESERLAERAIAGIMVNKDIITNKGEQLTPTDFDIPKTDTTLPSTRTIIDEDGFPS